MREYFVIKFVYLYHINNIYHPKNMASYEELSDKKNKWRTSQRISFSRAPELKRMSAEILDGPEEAIIECMKCPQCRMYLAPPCTCCVRGHFMCSACKEVINVCPVCGTTSFPNVRNTVFDKILEEMYYPCINEEIGCQALNKYSGIEEHLRHCSYQKSPCRFKDEGCKQLCTIKDRNNHEETCPFGLSCKMFLKANGKVKIACHWRGSPSQLYEHIKTHSDDAWLPSSLQTNVTFTWMIVMNMDVNKTECFRLDDVGEMFYFHVKSENEGNQCITVQHIGSEEVASKFMYSVEFKYGSKHVTYCDSVLPYSVNDVFDNQNCCNFHYKFLMYHFQAERVCDCYIRVFRKEQLHLRGKKILQFLGTEVTEERNGSVSNRESFQDKIECCIQSLDDPFDDETFA